MTLPSLQATSGNLTRESEYTIAQILADPETQALAPTVEPAHIELEKAIKDREAVDKLAIRAAAVANYRLGAVMREIVVFGTKVYGHYSSRTDEGFLRIFPRAPSEIANCNPSERVAVFGALRKAVVDPATPKELAAAGKVLVTKLDDLTAANATADKTAEALKAASKVEATAADKLQTATRKLRGQVTTAFPRDLARQRSYFGGKKTARRTKGAATASLPVDETT